MRQYYLATVIASLVLFSAPAQSQSISYSGTAQIGENLLLGMPGGFDFNPGVLYVNWRFDRPVAAEADVNGNWIWTGPTWGNDIHPAFFGTEQMGQSGSFYVFPQSFIFDYYGDIIRYGEQVGYLEIRLLDGAPAAYELNAYFSRSVPEPVGWTMLIGGFGLAGGAMRRRRLRVAYA